MGTTSVRPIDYMIANWQYRIQTLGLTAHVLSIVIIDTSISRVLDPTRRCVAATPAISMISVVND